LKTKLFTFFTRYLITLNSLMLNRLLTLLRPKKSTLLRNKFNTELNKPVCTVSLTLNYY